MIFKVGIKSCTKLKKESNHNFFFFLQIKLFLGARPYCVVFVILLQCFVYFTRFSKHLLDQLNIFENRIQSKHIEFNLGTYFGPLLNEQFSRAQLEGFRISNHQKVILRTTILSQKFALKLL